MLDAFTLDQLRMFVAIVDEGSFSAAARRLQRVQSAISHAMANLESILGLTLWDRQTRVPRLTESGEALLLAARRVLSEVDQLRRTADGLAGGLEAQLGLCVDQVFPVQGLVDLGHRFAVAFPTVSLRIHTETLQSVAERVFDDTCQLAVVGPAAETRDLVRHHVTSVRMLPCVGRDHPLARVRGKLGAAQLVDQVQIVLSERGQQRVPDQAVLSQRTWRVADLSTKHELIRAGLGWGNLPEHLVREDLSRRRLVLIRPEAWPPRGHMLSLTLVHRPGLTLGPATRWLIDNLTVVCRREVDTSGQGSASTGESRPAVARVARSAGGRARFKRVP